MKNSRKINKIVDGYEMKHSIKQKNSHFVPAYSLLQGSNHSLQATLCSPLGYVDCKPRMVFVLRSVKWGQGEQSIISRRVKIMWNANPSTHRNPGTLVHSQTVYSGFHQRLHGPQNLKTYYLALYKNACQGRRHRSAKVLSSNSVTKQTYKINKMHLPTVLDEKSIVTFYYWHFET